LLSGDLRLPYLLWLMAAERGVLKENEREPFRGLGPLTGSLQACVEFFHIDPDLVQAAAETDADFRHGGELPLDAIRAAVVSTPEQEKAELLYRLAAGDACVAMEIRRKIREAATSADLAESTEVRSLAELRARATAIREQRETAEAKRRMAELEQQKREVEALRRKRLFYISQRGEAVWDEVEDEINQRNATAYKRAKALLVDLRDLAKKAGTLATFHARLNALRSRHERKRQLIMRLMDLGGSD